MIISKRKYYRRLYITMLLVGVLISVSILTANKLLFHMNMIPKKEREELERIVKNISVLARQASIHLFMVMQSAGTENINATTRSNMSKILLGNAQSNIKVSTFGTGVDIPYSNCKMDKGQGLIQMARIKMLRVPTITDVE